MKIALKHPQMSAASETSRVPGPGGFNPASAGLKARRYDRILELLEVPGHVAPGCVANPVRAEGSKRFCFDLREDWQLRNGQRRDLKTFNRAGFQICPHVWHRQ